MTVLNLLAKSRRRTGRSRRENGNATHATRRLGKKTTSVAIFGRTPRRSRLHVKSAPSLMGDSEWQWDRYGAWYLLTPCRDSLIRHARKHSARANRDANTFPLSNEENANHVSIGPGPDHHQSSLPATFGSGFYDSANGAFQNRLNHTDPNGTAFGPLSDVSGPVPDSVANVSSVNLGSGTDETFWMLSSDLYQTLQGFSIPPNLPHDSELSLGASNPGQTLGTIELGRTPSEAPVRAEVWKSVRARWHTRRASDSPPQAQPIGSQNQDQVDEMYRAGLSHRLHPSPHNSTLPSADFLNLCIKLYFSKFHPIFPIIHVSSFRPSSENSLLLLSICSIGALFIGLESAKACGRAIFRGLNKALLTSWETYLFQGSRETLAIAQAITLGQTFGILSGNPNDLFLVESFHGTLIAWSRHAGIFRVKSALDIVDTETSDVESSWRSWIQAEESARVLLALHIQDAKISAIFHHEPLLRHEPERLPRCCPEELFGEPTAARWHEKLMSSKPATSRHTQHSNDTEHVSAPVSSVTSPPLMNSYASLAGIYASISEARASSLSDETACNLQRSLMLWADLWYASTKELEDSCCLMVLWNEAFMFLYADFDLLERVIGREGTSRQEEDIDAARKWTTSFDGKRCAAHAVLVLKHLELMPVGSEPAIHAPLAAFHAGIVVYVHTLLVGPESRPIEFDIPELPVRFSALRRTLGSRTISQGYKIDATTLSALTDLLRRQGHWEISRKFASILEVLLEDITDSGERVCRGQQGTSIL
ncbi:fungal-specific transcription factor domain-containing protein [Talaromyces proteolyticus]|uniref:Fungal-specific transcription factor domain-containing protein n=1 Tax=Talaromyces proteolyticus TaxID=1131652 RepID=A0AAD4Q697_9EURO|nr:fungal-specific transcription factor domain-containing protein [Talaromyces proteolyticus]KAH8705418.1 fungal-specific transcription factor domain-containing protein [Talaromyces proteolyticus]